MLSFGTPWVMGMAAVAALAIAALHLLSVRQPPTLWLPTARFVEAGDARAVARRPRPNDLLLLALRVAALLLAGAALAGARCDGGGPARVHLVVADSAFRSDSAAWWPRAVASADASAGTSVGTSADAERVMAVWATGVHTDPGAALVAAQREAARIANADRAVEQVALTVVVPSHVRSTRGWQTWRSAWPGAVHVVSHTARGDTIADPTDLPSRVPVVVQTSLDDDPVVAAFAGMRSAQPVVIVRDSVMDSTRDARDTIVVHWPNTGAPAAWQHLISADSIGGVAAREVALVAPFIRAFAWKPDSALADTPIVWWSDGETVATEHATATGCARAVYLPVVSGSDVLQGAAAAGVREALISPCGGALLSTAALTVAPQDSSASKVAEARAFRSAGAASERSEPWWLTPLLLVVALGLLIAEQVLRRREMTA
ncbi:MAG TPA: hypothetical protein VGE27_08475 [Gemmatimonas sp.]|uniref:hypothetical protein n=1 Tax=Gemmatimonas sp. TaxID=1962908 RepID=UPI002EDB0BB4